MALIQSKLRDRAFRVLAMVLALIAGVLIVTTSASAAPSGATLVVTPTTGLRDGDDISVKLNNPPASGGFQLSHCLGAACVSLVSDSWTEPPFFGIAFNFQLEDSILGTFCGTNCVIKLVWNAGAFDEQVVPLSFVTTTPPGAPTIDVTPNSALGTGKKVYVYGSGFPAGSAVGVRQCLNDLSQCTGTIVQPTATAKGNFSAFIQVDQVFDPQGPTTSTDCGTSGCLVRAVQVGGADATDTAPITFGAAEPPGPVPSGMTVILTPSTGLVEGQNVNRYIEGLPAGATAVMQQCLGDECNADPIASISTDEGATPQPFNITQKVHDNVAGTPCASSCVIRLRFTVGNYTDVTAPISFATGSTSTSSTSTSSTSTTTSTSTSTTTTLPPPSTTTTTLNALQQFKCNAAMAQRQLIINNSQTAYNNATTTAARNTIIKSYNASIKANDQALKANGCPPAPPAPPLNNITITAQAATQTYTVQPGDTLSAIAKKLLGDANLYNLIAAANPEITNPSLIRPGQILRIPAP